MKGFTAAEYTAAMYGFTYGLSMYEMKQFGSETQKVEWAEGQMDQAMETELAFVENDWWAEASTANSGGASDTYLASLQTYINSGTTTATDGGALPSALAAQSIAPFVETTGTVAVTVIGGIERGAAGAAYWACGIISPSSSAALTIQELDKVYNLAVVGKEEPDLIIVHRDLFSVLQNLSTFGGSNGGQIVSDPGSARMGHRKLYYRNAEVIMDDQCPTAGFVSNTSTARNYNIFCLNTKYLSMRMADKKPVFRTVPVVEAVKVYASEWMLQFTMKGAGRHHSRHVNITAP